MRRVLIAVDMGRCSLEVAKCHQQRKTIEERDLTQVFIESAEPTI